MTERDAATAAGRHPDLPEFTCPVWRPSDGEAYRRAQYQYATTSQAEATMSPGAIVRPRPPNADADVARALRYAREKGIAVALRTGGHSYTGTSSTSAKNIQLDLREAYPEWEYDEATGLIRCGVSRPLLDFSTRLAEHRRKDGTPDPLFMPAGQCYSVHLGGHCMTGGSGQLSRAFGFLADHILTAEVILPDGTRKKIGPSAEAAEDRKLFWAMFGGGPGNYAILTHITFKPYRDADYPYARCFKRVVPYDPDYDTEVLARLIELVAAFKDAPRDYDFCVTGGSGEIGFLKSHLGVANRDAYMSTFQAPRKGWFRGNKSPPVAGLAVFFQYSNLDGRPDTYDPSWCNRIKEALASGRKGGLVHRGMNLAASLLDHPNPLLPEARNHDDDEVVPISFMINKLWTYGGPREYSHPFIKNDALCRHESKPEFPKWAAERLNELFRGRRGGLMASMQMQQFGGPASKVVENGARGTTSFQWRDGMIVGLNVFYDASVPGSKTRALAWQERIDAEGTGTNPGYITPEPYRWFAYPTGNQVMTEAWRSYFTEEAYRECLEVKRAVDPHRVLSATPFALDYDKG